jgi:mannose/fructose/N-acetylgalactosamine-specific phosphotransferase system component IIC
MTKIRELIPLKLLIAAAVLFALSFVATPVLSVWVPDLQSSKNALLLAIPFLLVFIPILLLYMALTVVLSKILYQRVSERVYKAIEYVFIVGIVVGIISMFQPWTFLLFKPGFFILFGSLLGFMVWSHVPMKRERR